jgi:hypothetical protein
MFVSLNIFNFPIIKETNEVRGINNWKIKCETFKYGETSETSGAAYKINGGNHETNKVSGVDF